MKSGNIVIFLIFIEFCFITFLFGNLLFPTARKAYFEVKQEYSKLILSRRIKRNQKQASIEWYRTMRWFLERGKKNIAKADKYSRPKLIGFYNPFVIEYQTAILRYSHGCQYSQVQKDLWKCLPKEIQ